MYTYIIIVTKLTLVIYGTIQGDDRMKYGYCRISTPKQSIERQVRNIQSAYPDAMIIKEVYTGRKFQGRKKMDYILAHVKKDDTIIFDSVSRMSRDAEEGFEMYENLFRDGINLVFLKEPHINTSVYKKALTNTVQLTGTNVDFILEGVNKYLMALAKEQIQIAFDQAEKEVADLRQRTREGIITARMNGKQIGLPKGTKIETNKAIQAKKTIKKYNKSFGGTLTNEETWKIAGISKNSFYKYKHELATEETKDRISGQAR